MPLPKPPRLPLVGFVRRLALPIGLLAFRKVGCKTQCPSNDRYCLLYTSDAADASLRVDLGGRRII